MNSIAEENFIKITGSHVTINLPIKENVLNIDQLRLYFPEATSLTYLNENKENCGVEMSLNGDIKIKKNIFEYEIFPHNLGKKLNSFEKIVHIFIYFTVLI